MLKNFLLLNNILQQILTNLTILLKFESSILIFGENNMKEEISEAYLKAVVIISEKGTKSISEYEDKKCSMQIDEHWFIALHGNVDEVRSFCPPGGMECELKYGILGIWFNGWLAGIIHSFGGVISGGEAANEDNFIKALENYDK